MSQTDPQNHRTDWQIDWQTVSADSLLLTWRPQPQARPMMEEALPQRIRAFRQRLQQAFPAGTFVNLVPAYASLWLQCDLTQTTLASITHRLDSLLQAPVYDHEILENENPDNGRLIELPVCYDPAFGFDLKALADAKNTTPQALAQRHAEQTYQVHAIGFSPGFAYLGQLPEDLAAPRHAEPRLTVPAGSVAIADRQTAVYPIDTPAGWQIIGRTPLDFSLNNPDNLDRFQVGDRVRFQPIDRATFDRIQSEQPMKTEAATPTRIKDTTNGFRVKRNAFGASIQDDGRIGLQHQGLAPSGALDKTALFAANWLLNQPLDCAVLEIPMGGCELEAKASTFGVVTGADLDLRVNGHPQPRYQAFAIHPGDRLHWHRPRQGLFAYFAVSGGWQTPVFFQSRSFNGRENLGQPLQLKDRLPLLSNQVPPSQTWPERQLPASLMTLPSSELTLRFVPAFQWQDFSKSSQQSLLQQNVRVSSQSNRIATRLKPEQPIEVPYQKLLSEPMADGSIQIPPNGEPIVMQADRPTIGGYPKIGTVLPQDLYRLAQAQPGTRIQLQPISARAAELKQHHWLSFWANKSYF
ncbi:5-oxoprolinase subunit PxpB [Hydrogenovibrio halophilus]|uniref:5-oxoprolinase subunit PxpB n=1 Tax=Hydrogenovibrio halophilus TaxID=373391 RepID=UPI000382635F|nr:5-oxoprolinase subunit PxpB [Hydrogenovibrio halophilus]